MRIDDLSNEDLEQVAQLHLKSFKSFFLSSLGYKFLFHFYKAIINDAHGFGICAYDDENNVLGFAVGTLKPNGFYSTLLRHNMLVFIKSAFLVIIRKPSIVFSLLKKISNQNSFSMEQYALLLSICVNPDKQTIGLGSALIAAFENKTKVKYVKGIYLTTDALENDYANIFYRKNGYIIEKEFETKEGRLMNVYSKKNTD